MRAKRFWFVLSVVLCLLAAPGEVSIAATVPVGNSYPICGQSSCADGAGGRPAIAGDGTNFFMVWKDTRNQGTSLADVYGARVSHNGTVLDASGIAISTSTGDLQNNATPSVAFDGTNYFVVWVSTVPGGGTSEIFGARVSTPGTGSPPTCS